MKQTLDKTAEIEIKLKQILIIPENTCLFFKKDISAVSAIRRCENCVYASFEDSAYNAKRSGFCCFKSDSRAV